MTAPHTPPEEKLSNSPRIYTFTVSSDGESFDGDLSRQGTMDIQALSYGIAFLIAVMIEWIGPESAREVVADLITNHAEVMPITTHYHN